MRRSQDVHSMGKQRNINAPSVTLGCMIIVYQLFMDLESDLLQSCLRLKKLFMTLKMASFSSSLFY